MLKLLKKIRFGLFLFCRPIFFRLLRILNSDYQELPSLKVAAQELPPTELPIHAHINVLRPVVLNSNRSSMTPEALRFMLRGMGWTQIQIDMVWDEFDGQLNAVAADEFLGMLETWLLQKVRSGDDTTYFDLLSKLFSHKNEVRHNQRAYLESGREYPNAVFWPDPTNASNKRSLYTELPLARRQKFINSTTRIVSAGSCFATEIAHYLIGQGYNYLVTEGNGGPEMSYEVLGMGELPNASAAWGIIFNTPSFRQLVERAFGYRQLPKILWSQPYKGESLLFDPFRENVAFRSLEAYESNYAEHTNAIRRAFSTMDVFIITLGLNEVWSFAADGSVFSRSPWRIAPSLVRRHVMTVEENVADLQRMAELLRHVNPQVRIICTVSPVPLHATFRGDDQHVVVANAHSKAILRVAAEEFVSRCPETYYFPSYEIVTTSTEYPWEPDQRHVSRAAVANVMSAFTEMYVQ